MCSTTPTAHVKAVGSREHCWCSCHQNYLKVSQSQMFLEKSNLLSQYHQMKRDFSCPALRSEGNIWKLFESKLFTLHSLHARLMHAVINNVQITRNNSLSWGGSIPCTCSQIAQPPPSNRVLPWVVAQPLWKSILSLSDRKSIKTFPPSTQLPTASLHVL